MNIVIGYYNKLSYRVHNVTTNDDLYTAGNSPYDSQACTSKEQGIGIEIMKRYCEQATREIAKEQNAKYGGIEYE